MKSPTNPKQRSLVNGLIFIGLIIVCFFGWRTARAFREVRQHRPPPPFMTQPVETDVSLIRDWMTVPFISKMYRVPPPLLFESLGIRPHGNEDKSLKQLNEEYFPEADGIILEKMKTSILAIQAQETQIGPHTPPAP